MKELSRKLSRKDKIFLHTAFPFVAWVEFEIRDWKTEDEYLGPVMNLLVALGVWFIILYLEHADCE